eukprot:2995848-Pleurochrysis_carterae.AAC.1
MPLSIHLVLAVTGRGTHAVACWQHNDGAPVPPQSFCLRPYLDALLIPFRHPATHDPHRKTLFCRVACNTRGGASPGC